MDDKKELEEKILRLEGCVDELRRLVYELQKDSHPMHLMPCKYKESGLSFVPPSYPPGYGPLGPVVTC